MKKVIYTLSVLFCLSAQVYGQAPGSVTAYGGALLTKSVASGGTSSDVSETVYIGPGTHQVEGTWEIYARQLVIDPTAVISGDGTIIYYNPSAAGGAASATLVDGNARTNAIDVNQQLQNASGMQLREIAFPASHTAAGWTDNPAASTLYSGRDLNLATDGADITLGTDTTGDLRMDADAGISNYGPARMVIGNNSILSHMVKENFTSDFVFPIGIADGDYTPVQIGNLSSITVHAAVQDYVASTSYEQTLDPGPAGVPSDGMSRTWHIYANTAGSGSTLNLQHNTATNQSGFTDFSHFVTRWGTVIPNPTGDNVIAFSTSAWQSNTAASGATGNLSTAGVVAGSSMRSRAYAALATSATDAESYFTKSSDPFHPLPLDFLSLKAESEGCTALVEWTVHTGLNILGYTVQHSTDGRNYTPAGTVQHRAGKAGYSFRHQQASGGHNFYAIEMHLADGKKIRSETVKRIVDCAIPAPVSAYPNPAASLVSIINLQPEPYTAALYSQEGKLLITKQTGGTADGRLELDVRALMPGMYLLKVWSASGKTDVIKLNKE